MPDAGFGCDSVCVMRSQGGLVSGMVTWKRQDFRKIYLVWAGSLDGSVQRLWPLAMLWVGTVYGGSENGKEMSAVTKHNPAAFPEVQRGS